ncbi:hypothetical protein EQZ09_11960 [Clostridium perfringens]|nr:hypothetical protein [Clostridium perfringens]
MKIERNASEIWKSNCLKLNKDIEQKEKLTEVFYNAYDFLKINNWSGACHAVSSIQYILLSEIGLKPKLCIGVVQIGRLKFDHSWIELNEKVYDITIENSLIGEIAKSIIADCDINTLEKTNITYGINEFLDRPASIIKDLSITEYLDGFCNQPKSEIPYFLNDGLWNLIIKLGKKINLDLDINNLRLKYSNVKRVIK